MSASIHPPIDPRPVSEPAYVPDTFVTDIADVRVVAGGYRITFVADRDALGENPAERIVVAHLIIPRECSHGIVRHLSHRCRS